MLPLPPYATAGEGNRTLIFSLEGCGSTIELHPHKLMLFVSWPAQLLSYRPANWGVQDSNLRRHCHQIYSLTPLTARETPPSARTFTANIPEPSEFASLSETHCPQTSYNELTELAEGLEPTTC